MTIASLLKRFSAVALSALLLASPAVAQDPKKQPGPDDPRIQMLEAIMADDSSRVRELLVAGVDPNIREADHGPAVVMAASVESYGALAELAAARQTKLEATNAKGETALLIASRKGHIQAVKALLEGGAELNPDGWTPLHMAAGNGHEDLVRVLIDSQANLNALSENGTTAMMLAARMGHMTAYQEIVKAGADPTVINEADLSAADYLDRRGESERADLLRVYAAKYQRKAAKTN